MVDREARDRAAELVRQFRDGEINNDEFEERWPARSEDRGVRAVASALWFTYDDLSTHTMTERLRECTEQAELFTRSWLFLLSDLEYEWPEDCFIGMGFVPGCGVMLLSLPVLAWSGGYGWRVPAGLAMIALGIALLICARVAGRRESRAMAAAGDMSVWPFICRDDYEAALLQVEAGGLPVAPTWELPRPPETIWEVWYPLPFLLIAIFYPVLAAALQSRWVLALWPVVAVGGPLAWAQWCARREGRRLSWRRRRKGA